jgi:type I restriction enzyme S subunit
VPKLRFPEFDGEWVVEKLSDFTERITRKNTENQTSLPLTISSKDGLVDQISYFNKTVASKDMSGYYLLLNGEFAYNKSYSVGYDFGSIKRLDKYPMGALSTLYICFALKKYNSDYIKVYFDSLKWYKEIYMIAAEGARNHGLLNVPTDLFFETKHFIPKNEKEQKKIAEFLMLLNSRIEKQRQLVENLKTYKRGVVLKLFAKYNNTPEIRFNDFNENWENQKLGNILSVVPFKKFVKNSNSKGRYPVIQQGDSPIAGYADGEPFECYEQIVLFGDHTLSLYKPHSPFFISSDGIKILYSDNLNGEFLYYLLFRYMPSSEGYKRHFSIIKEINVSFTRNILEQTKIAHFINCIDRKIEIENKFLDKLNVIKKSLLLQMFV